MLKGDEPEPLVEMSPEFQQQLYVSKKGVHVGHVDFTVELRDTLYLALDQGRTDQMIAQLRAKEFATNGLYSLCQVVYASNAEAPGEIPRLGMLQALRYMRDSLAFFVMQTPWFASNPKDRKVVQSRVETAFEVYVGLMLEQPVTVQGNRLLDFLPLNSDAMVGTQDFLTMLYDETQKASTGFLSVDSHLQLGFMVWVRHCCEQNFASSACHAPNATVDRVEEACRLLGCFLNEAHDRKEKAALHVVELCVQKIHSLAATSEFNYEEDVEKLADYASKPVPKFLGVLHGCFHECLGNGGYDSLFATSTAFQGDALEVSHALELEQIEEQKSRDAAYAARVSEEWNEEGEARQGPPAAAPAAQKKKAAASSEVEMARQLAQQALSPPSSPPHPLVMELEALRADHASLAAFHRGVMAERDSLNAERSSLEAAHHNLQDEYEKLANGVQGLQQDKQALYRLRGEHMALQETYDVLKAENESLRAEAKPSEPKCLERAAAEAQELREQLEAREAELKACQVELQEEAGKFIAAHGVLQDENQRLKAQLQGLGNGTDALEKTLRENQLLKEQLRGLEKDKEALEQKLHDAAQAKGRIEAAGDQAERLDIELELVEATGELKEEKRKCRGLTEELDTLRERVASLQDTMFVLLVQLSHVYFPFIQNCPTWNENYHRHLFIAEKCYQPFYEAVEKYNDMTEAEWGAFAKEIEGQGNGNFTACLLHLFAPAVNACRNTLAEVETVERLARSETFLAKVPALLKRVVDAKETPDSVRSEESEAVVQYALNNGTAGCLISCLYVEGVMDAPKTYRTIVKQMLKERQHYEMLSGVQAIADAAAADLDSRAAKNKEEAERLHAEPSHKEEVIRLAGDIGAWKADAEAFRDLSAKLAPEAVKQHFSHEVPGQASFTMELVHLMMWRLGTAPSVETGATAE